MRRLFVVAVLLLSIGSRLYAADEIVFVESPCPFLIWEPEIEGETIVCGTVAVPESWYGRSDGIVTLQVAILKTTATDPASPIIYLQGGPGGSAVADVHGWLNSALRQHADLILFDQRGTGHSLPSLNCFEGDDDNLPADVVAEEVCRDRLIAEGVVLEAYNSAESAADVAALVEALGLEQVTLYGVSYGTRLALTVIRDFPEVVYSAIIDSVYPPHVNGYDEQIINAALAFEVLFRDCEASQVCNAAFPNLRETFFTMLDDLNADPMVNEDGGEVTGDQVVDELFRLMYISTALPFLPAAIDAAARGNLDDYLRFANMRTDDWAFRLGQMTEEELDEYAARFLSFESVEAYLAFVATLTEDELAELVEEIYSREPERSPAEREALNARLMALLALDTLEALEESLSELDDETYSALVNEAYGDIDSDSEGFFNSVECYEEVPFNTLELAAELAAGVPEAFVTSFSLSIERQFLICEMWGIEAADDYENEPVASDIPVLVMSGEYDPVTPPLWGQAAADFLPNSTHVVLPGMGHGLIDVVGFPCPTSIAIQFLHDPFSPLDASCVEEMGSPAFFAE